MDKYAKKYRRAIKQSKTDEEIETIINKIYEDGFQDGIEEAPCTEGL
jgi:hypothetical protein